MEIYWLKLLILKIPTARNTETSFGKGDNPYVVLLNDKGD